MKLYFLLLFSLFTIVTMAQDQDERHSISINMLNYEHIQQAALQYERVYAWRSFSSIKYQLNTFENFYWQVNAAYAKQSIKEGCNNCSETGTGKLQELQLTSGIGNKFKMFNQEVIMPFIEVNLYYVRSYYLVDIYDVTLDPIYIVNRKTSHFGINPHIGLELRPLKHFGLRFFCSGALYSYRIKKGTGSSGGVSSDSALGAEVVVYF